MAIRRDDFPLPDVNDPLTAPFFAGAARGARPERSQRLPLDVGQRELGAELHGRTMTSVLACGPV